MYVILECLFVFILDIYGYTYLHKTLVFYVMVYMNRLTRFLFIPATRLSFFNEPNLNFCFYESFVCVIDARSLCLRKSEPSSLFR